MPAALKVGAKGGTYYVSDKGKKVYADKLPGAKKPKKPKASKDKKAKATAKGGVHPTHSKKVEGFKKKGQATGEKFEGQELFVGGKGNHFYVNPKTGKKVIFTKKKSKELGLGGKAPTKTKKPAGAKKPTKEKVAPKATPAQKEKIWEAKNDLSHAKMGLHPGDKQKAIAKAKEKVAKLEEKFLGKKPSKVEPKAAPPSKGKGHPKEAKYEQHKTAHKTADGQQVFKGKGGNYFTVHPTKGTKQIITKASAKSQGFHGGGKASKGAYSTKAAADAQQKGFKATPLGSKVTKSAGKQWDDMPYSQQSALKHYTGSGYKQTNKSLRKPPPTGNSKERIASMDKAFAQTVNTEHDYTVYRGTSTNSGRIPPPVGGLYADDGYSSMSFKKGTAKSFGGGKKNTMFMTVDVPKGSKALYMGKNSHHKSEKELLVDRGAKVRIVSRKKDSFGIWHVRGILESTHNSK